MRAYLACQIKPHMLPSLTVDILTHLDAGDVTAAAACVETSNSGEQLIELLDLLWNTDTPRSKALIAPVLQRLEHLRPTVEG